MIILGIDPGKAIGFCLYDTAKRRAVISLVCPAEDIEGAVVRLLPHADLVAIERPRIYQSGGNDIADACEQFGWLLHRCGGKVTRKDLGGGASAFGHVAALERRAVTGALSRAMGQQVQGDAGVWRALMQLHGPDADRAPQAAVTGRPYLPRIQSVTATKTRAAVQGQREQTAIAACAEVPAGPLFGVASHARQALAVAWAAAEIDAIVLECLPF